MNKHNKLARNAIRIRKAQAKRENEPNKPKKGRKWYSRLFALVGCLLLVSALVVPCAADQFDNAWFTFLPPVIRDTVLCRTYYSSFIAVDCLMLGAIDTNQVRLGINYEDTIYGRSTNVVLNDVNVHLYLNSVRAGYKGSIDKLMQDVRLRVEFINDYEDNAIEIYFGDSVPSPVYMRYSMDLLEGESAVAYLREVVIDGVSYYVDFYDEDTDEYLTDFDAFEIAIEFNFSDGDAHYPPENPSMIYNIASLLYGYKAYENVVFPNTFKDSYLLGAQSNPDYQSAFDEGYSEGYGYGVQDGLTEGFKLGRVDGYVEGFHDGKLENTTYADGYDDGYTTAVNEIDNGDFGRNFLSGVFTAPLDALRDFTIVQWNTSDGTTVTINLITILSGIVGLSLFVWFLKMFAGG